VIQSVRIPDYQQVPVQQLGSISVLQASNLGLTQLCGFLLVFLLLLLHFCDQPIGSFSETPDLLMDVFPEHVFQKALVLQSGYA
jgi:hypothetical protein